MTDLRLEELSASNALAASTLELRPGQEEFANPTTYVQADATIDPARAWSRVIMDGDTVVGVVRAYFDPDYPDEELRSCLWNISVSADAQGTGVGRFAIAAVVQEAQDRGLSQLSVMWEDGEHGPGQFFRRMGFEDRGVTRYGDRIGVLEFD